MISHEIFLFFNRFKKKKENHALRSIHQPEDLKCTPHRNSAVRSWGGGDQVSQCILAYLGIAPTAHHCIPFGHVYTAWMADQVVVHSSHISILVSRHRAINVVEYGVLITI